MKTHSIHEIIRCERCGKSMECKANANGKCQCSAVELNLNEMQYISENYEGCMCAECLGELKEEYTICFSPDYKSGLTEIFISMTVVLSKTFI